MTNSKATKKALFMSMLSLLLCFTMLMGATFAWFTDTVTSTNNRIVAGNLDVDLVMYKQNDAGEWGYHSIAGGNGDIFSEATGNGINWEPGKTEIVYLGVKNLGSLALKYNILLDIVDGEIPLSGSLEYAIIDKAEYNANQYANWQEVKAAAGNQVAPMPTGTGLLAAENGTLDGVLTNLDVEEVEYFALAVHMKEEATNEYQNGSITIDVTVVATQLAAEVDSFGPTYDENADFDGQISGIDSLKAALAKGGDYQVISDLSLTEPMKVENNLELSLGDNTVTGGIEVASGADLTISGGKVESDNFENSAIQNNGGALTLNDVQITSARHGVRVEGGTVTINSGIYKVEAVESGKTQHALNVSDGGNVTINGGTFVGPRGTGADSGAAVNVQAGSTVTINGGDFSGGLNNTLASKGTLIVKGGTFDQDPSAYVADGYVATKNADSTWTVVDEKYQKYDQDISSSDFTSSISAGGEYNLTEDVTTSQSISKDIAISLGGNTINNKGTINVSNNADLKLTNGKVLVNDTYGHYDVRPTSASEPNEVTFIGVDFTYDKKNNTYGPSTNRLGSVVEFCATETGAKTIFKFKDCTFNNAQVLFEGMSGKTGEFEATFENCTFNALTSSAPICVQNYVNGTINVIGCTFNLEVTSSTASAISVSSSSSTAVKVVAKNNTLNAVAATPTDTSVTGVDVVKVNGTPANIKLVSIGGTTSSASVTGTTATGIAVAD